MKEENWGENMSSGHKAAPREEKVVANLERSRKDSTRCVYFGKSWDSAGKSHSWGAQGEVVWILEIGREDER